jgi:hypothetical protein
MNDQAHQRRWPKLVASICILAYGALVTFGALVVVGIGNALAMNARDGSASVHRTTERVVWPVALFYAISAAGPYVCDPGRRALLFVAALVVLLIGLFATVEPSGAGLIAGIAVVASVVVWGPLAVASANKGSRKGRPTP